MATRPSRAAPGPGSQPATASRQPGGEPTDIRPAGPLVWAHTRDPEDTLAVLRLAQRLDVVDPDITLLVTVPSYAGNTLPPLAANVRVVALNGDSAGAARRFLRVWRPDICLWLDGLKSLKLLTETLDQSIPTTMIGVRSDQLDLDRWRWFPPLGGAPLDRVASAMATDKAARNRLVRLGLPEEAVTVTGALREGAAALPFDEDELDAVSAQIGARPLWLAAMVHATEGPMISAAHRTASRSAPRLLLILAPADTADTEALAAALREDGWYVSRRSLGDRIEDNTQVYLADSCDELGLWYRIAPVTFMGSSVANGVEGRDPFEPAALGSAILYGPNVGRYLKSYSRLAQAGAARIVKDAGSLAQGLQRLLAPDQAAAQAHAAWDVASQDAEVTDKVLELIVETLEARGLV